MEKNVRPARPGLRTVLAVAALTLAIAAATVLPAAAYHLDDMTQHPFASQGFRDRWERTDQPVIDGQDRTWIWGPSPYTEGMIEPYLDAPGDMRLVQYFDKSRMEMNNPAEDPDDLWYVTNGLLVLEMVEGRYQIGDAAFDDSPQPAGIPIAGDPDVSPDVSYATINELGLRDLPALSEGTTIAQTIVGDQVSNDDDYAGYGVEAEYRVQVDGIDHTVASVFWEFMNSEGIVYENHQAVTDLLFPNAFYATGYPITEAYWSTVNVEGFPRDVLWQCFERRCLTYTPGNEQGWQVESGNVGQHYFQWRYGAGGPAMETIELGLVAAGDEGAQGPEFGCEDSLVTVNADIQQLADVEHQIHAAVQRLFVTEPGELYNVFLGADLVVEQVSVEDGRASISLVGDLLLGGACDEPRVEEQLRATATQFAGIDDIEILLNGETWEPGQ